MKKIISTLLLISLVSFSFMSCLSTPKEDIEDPNVWLYNPTQRSTTIKAPIISAISVKNKVTSAASNSTVYMSVEVSSNEDFTYLKEGLSSRDDVKVNLHLVLEDNIHTIIEKAFENCKLLTYLVVDGPLYTISPKAFSNCTYLNTVILPNTVSYIDSTAFYKCLSLNGLIVGEENASLLEDKDYIVDYIDVIEASSLIANHNSGTLALSIFIEDEIDIFALINDIEMLPKSALLKLDLALASDMKVFNKSQFRKFKNVEIISIFGNAVIK